ncbi:hypothetical protein ACQYAD_08350 [Neobacillus sp. SM06]|uniref:hypothetical protein n=1 Tax=Neobacillus sp. SM06 TaxID=3422492 RepID=UPI003D2815DA
MKLTYKFNEDVMKLTEAKNGADIEFNITFLTNEFKPQIEKVEKHFSENQVITDVLVYAHKNHHYQIIVRKDFYDEFIIELFKHRLLLEVKWV